MSNKLIASRDPWQQLRKFTSARIALGRAGTSLPTTAQLDFQAAHAQARDAVHLPFDYVSLHEKLHVNGKSAIVLHSAATDRQIYLQRPDLGRRLNADSVKQLRELSTKQERGCDLAVVIADGLSALAVHRHSLPFLNQLMPLVETEGWSLAPVALVQQGRVAVADEVAELLGAKMVLILIGERPGLSSPDSLGLYFTYAPRTGVTDAQRNCISNIRQEGLSYSMAAFKLMYLMREAWKRKISGVELKDEAQLSTLKVGLTGKNFLVQNGP